MALSFISTNDKCDRHVLGCTLAHVCCNRVCAVELNLGGGGGGGSSEFRLPPRAMTHFDVRIALFATFLWSLWISPASSPRFS